METKSKVRRIIRQERALLSPEECQKRSIEICSRLLAMEEYKKTKNLLVYAATQNEVDLNLVIEQAWNHNKNVFFPKTFGNDMEFYLVRDMGELKPGNFHVLEPTYLTKELCFQVDTIDQMTLVLTPGVAFDFAGHRIGYGKGYYDRYLSRNNYLYPVGVAYQMQICSSLEEDLFDIKMKKLVTEKEEVIVHD